MRKVLVGAMCVVLVAIGCSDDQSAVDAPNGPVTVADSTQVDNGVEQAVAVSSAASSQPPDSLDTVAPPAATAVVAASATSLTPTVVCVGNEGSAYFGYINGSPTPVTVPAGPNNELIAAAEFDEPLMPTLFAPGEVIPAFYAFGVDPGGLGPTWTITGPDGVERTAQPTEETPICDLAEGDGFDGVTVLSQILLDTSPRDQRKAGASFVATLTSPVGVEPIVAEVEITLTGVPPTSVCHPAFEALPVETWFDLPDGTRIPGARHVISLTPEPWTRPIDGRIIPHAVASVSIAVVDNCSANGMTQRSWPLPPEFDDVGYDVTVCVDVVDGVLVSYSGLTGSCGELGFTGGSRIRMS